MLGLAVVLHGILSPILASRPLAWLVAFGALGLLATAERGRPAARHGALVLLALILPLVAATVVDVMDPTSNHYADGVPTGEYPGGELWWTGLFAVPAASLAVLGTSRGGVSRSMMGTLVLAGAGVATAFLYEPLNLFYAGGLDAQIVALAFLSLAHLIVLWDLWREGRRRSSVP